MPRTFLKMLAALLVAATAVLTACVVQRRALTLEQAQREVQRRNSPDMRNRRYYRAYPQ